MSLWQRVATAIGATGAAAAARREIEQARASAANADAAADTAIPGASPFAGEREVRRENQARGGPEHRPPAEDAMSL